MPAEIRLANITFILSMSLQLRQFWIMCPTYLLLVPFYTVLSQILALTDAGISHRPTCPNQPDSRVATRPLPRPLYFWYLVQFETCIVVTEYCPCESIKHQVVKRRFIGSIPPFHPGNCVEMLMVSRIVLRAQKTRIEVAWNVCWEKCRAFCRSRLREETEYQWAVCLLWGAPTLPPAETWSPAKDLQV